MDVDARLLLRGDRRALARAITLVESTLERHREASQRMLQEVLPHTGNSTRVGISGAPGVGKSTFIEAFGLHLLALGRRVAVLAVDPSSPVRGGSILADKTRMEELSRADGAFIRPSPSGGALGGVAQKTREAVLLCEAAGYDVVLVETMGVGQSEFAVAGMVDFFLVLMIPNAGDELQGIKRGIMELVDGLVINKADGESLGLAEMARSHYQNALALMDHSSFWTPRVLTCSAREKAGIREVWEMIEDYRSRAGRDRQLQGKRAQQDVDWMNRLVLEGVRDRLRRDPAVRAAAQAIEERVRSGATTPYQAAHHILELLWEMNR